MEVNPQIVSKPLTLPFDLGNETISLYYHADNIFVLYYNQNSKK